MASHSNSDQLVRLPAASAASFALTQEGLSDKKSASLSQKVVVAFDAETSYKAENRSTATKSNTRNCGLGVSFRRNRGDTIVCCTICVGKERRVLGENCFFPLLLSKFF